jgi:hypothetical protein
VRAVDVEGDPAGRPTLVDEHERVGLPVARQVPEADVTVDETAVAQDLLDLG